LPNGSWSLWIEEEESVIRKYWGASRARFALFKEVTANLGIAINKAEPSRLRFSIHEIPDELEQRDIAARRLTAFRNLFLDNCWPNQFAAANPPARTSEGRPPEAQPAKKQDFIEAQHPESSAASGAQAFPSLPTEDELEARLEAETRRRAEAKSIDHLAVIKQSYPRIAAAIELTWGHRECENYMNKLILNDRHGRAGFPQPIMDSLLALYRRHTRESVFASTLDLWADRSK
jgi:hypothetical protein